MKISFKNNKNNWYPEEPMEINVTAEENSLVCLIGGRGTENASPSRYTFTLVFNQKWMVANISIDINIYIWTISPCRNMDDDTDLLESGLLFLEKRLDGKVTTSRQSDLYPKHHSFLDAFSMDQLWMWKCINFTWV